MTQKILDAIAAYSMRVAEKADTDYPKADAHVIAAELRAFFDSVEGQSLIT